MGGGRDKLCLFVVVEKVDEKEEDDDEKASLTEWAMAARAVINVKEDNNQ